MSPARGASVVCEKLRVLASQWRDIRALTMNDASAARPCGLVYRSMSDTISGTMAVATLL
jgi:hypothetical protein